ncbi:hypothetical protein HDZ31DRAFT_74032 [Schizophyllum fasciatum]
MSLLGSSPSSAFALAYALPLFFVSILLTFAGTFLTLDRTRSFPHPSYKAIPGTLAPPRRKITFALEGGVGGLALGYSFGVQFASFMAVCIPAVTSASPLSSKSFIAVWLLPSVVTTLLGGRWKYGALALAGITGGALFALGISVIIHPNLLTRIVLAAVLVPLSTVLALLPFARTQRPIMRLCTAATGAFGMVVTIAILADIPAWANVWQRLVQRDNVEWGTGKEQGLSAAFGILVVLGMASDLLLRRKLGECPDEKWDGYLADYAANLPDQPGRAGTFQPLQSAWDRLLHGRRTPTEKALIFPDERFQQDTKHPVPSPPASPTARALLPAPQSRFRLARECLRKPRGHPRLHGFGRRPREAVKFRPFGRDIEDEDEDGADGGDALDAPPPPARPWLRARASFASSRTATATLVDEREPDAAAARVGIRTKLGTDSPDCSDCEEVDVAAAGGEEEWRQRTYSGGGRSSGGARSSDGNRTSATLTVRAPPLGAVPATPSLIRAIDRIQQAQKVAFAPDGMPRLADDAGLLSPRIQGPATPQHEHWDGFWKDVRDRARS